MKWTSTNLTHWGRVTHICVSNLIIIVSDNGLSPGRRQAIIWTNAGILLIGPLGTKLSEILIEILTFLYKKMHLKVSSAKWRPFCPGLNVLTPSIETAPTSLHKKLIITTETKYFYALILSVLTCLLTVLHTHPKIRSSLVQVMAFNLLGANPLSQPMMAYLLFGSWEQI